MDFGGLVRVFDFTTEDDLGLAHVPLPIEPGDELALAEHVWPFEVLEVVPMIAGSWVAAIVRVRPAVPHVAR